MLNIEPTPKEAYQLPNRSIDANSFNKNYEKLRAQLGAALAHDEDAKDAKQKIQDLKDYSGSVIKRLKDILETDPAENAVLIVQNLQFIPEKHQLEAVQLALQANPREVENKLIWSLGRISNRNKLDIARLIIEKSPKFGSFKLMSNIHYFPEKNLLSEIVKLCINSDFEQALDGFLLNSRENLEENIFDAVSAIIKNAPEKNIVTFLDLIDEIPERQRDAFLELVFKNDPKQYMKSLIENVEEITEDEKVEFLKAALRTAPKETAGDIIINIDFLEKERRIEIAALAIEHLSNKEVFLLLCNITYIPEESRESVSELAMKKLSKESICSLLCNIECLPIESQVGIAKLAMQLFPKEAAAALMWESILKGKIINSEIRTLAESELLKSNYSVFEWSEEYNPSLYKDIIKRDDDAFLRRNFEKTGPKTIILGKEHFNKNVLRIIPRASFTAWLKAYSEVDTWKENGFDYVPIEPIIKAFPDKNDENMRIYAAVLGMNLHQYKKISTNEEHCKDLDEKAKKIRQVLIEMGIDHKHDHDGNFCILHERTENGEIDWSAPPRIYCIDFDVAIYDEKAKE